MSSVSPSTVLVGATDTTVTLAGSGFTGSTTVSLNGTSETTTYVSATQVTAVIPAAQLATAASLTLTAANGTSASTPVAFAINNPAPAITSLSANSVVVGSTPAVITVTGTGFVKASTVLVNGTARATTYSSGTQLGFTPTTADFAAAATLAISVNNPAPGGGTSATTNLAVTAPALPAPSISGINTSIVIANTPTNVVIAGSGDATVLIAGTNFTSNSVAMAGTAPLATTFVSGTQLNATIPAANVNALAALPITVKTPTATADSNVIALPVATALSLNLNHIVYDPYNRKLWATTGATTPTLAGSSIVSIDPATGAIGTPISVPGNPYAIAISDSGKTLYALTATSVARYDLTTATLTSAAVPGAGGFANLITNIGFSVAPGTENELVIAITNLGTNTIGIYDYNTTANTVVARPQTGSMPGHYTYCPTFLDANNLIVPNNSNGTNILPVTSTGLGASTATSSSTLTDCMKTAGATGYSTSGAVNTFTPTSITQSAIIPLTQSESVSVSGIPVAPDLSLHQVFFGGNVSGVGNGPEELISASTDSNLINFRLRLPINARTQSGSFYYPDDLFRWGQDGLAFLVRDDSGSHQAILYSLRGPFVVPQEIGINTPASITATSSSTLAVGTGNTLLTLTGSNFIPGVAVTWNGSYRTTTIIDATHLTVAIPASDFAAAGSGKLIATNPGALPSTTLTVTVQ